MRLMSFVALIARIVSALIPKLHKDAGVEGLSFRFGFWVAAFPPKALQDFVKSKIPQVT
jgi:hypothetical protein